MKREYVKPVMESEEFVANEYVASCWDVTCEGTLLGWGIFGHEKHGKLDTVRGLSHEPTFDSYDRDGDGFSKRNELTFVNGQLALTEVHYYGDHGNVRCSLNQNPNASI